MRPFRSSRVLLLVVAVLLAAAPATLAAAQTSSGWSQFQGGATHTGAASGPQPPYTEAWTLSVPPGGDGNRYGLSAAVLADGLAIAVGPVSVVAVDLVDGVTAWTVDRELGPSVPPAVADTPDGPVVLFTDGWGAGPPDASSTASASPTPTPSPTEEEADPVAHLVAIGLDDQTERWRLDLPAVSRTGVTVVGNLALVGSNDGTITAVDLATGDRVWEADAGGRVGVSIAADDTIAVVPVVGGTERGPQVVAFALADGTEVWRTEPLTRSPILGPVALDGDLAYVAPYDGTVRALSLSDGSERWSSRLNAGVPLTAPVLTGDAIVVADERGQVYLVDAATGERRWDHAANAVSFRSNPVVAGDAVLLGTLRDGLLAFDLATGDLTARLSSPSSPVRGLAVSDDVIVAVRGGTEAGMVAFATDPEGTLLAEVSPTTPDAGVLVTGWLLGAAGLAVILGLLGRLVSRTTIAVEVAEDGRDDEEEPT